MAYNETLVSWSPPDSSRSTLQIIYSCVITLILCIWVSTYPNIPSPNDKWYHKIQEKVHLAMIGALGPDLLFAIALGQWCHAKLSVKYFLKQWPNCGWTTTHGFYADMGGYRIQEQDSELNIPVNSEQLYYLIKHGYIDMPRTTLKEIKQISSVDLFSKLIVLWQMFWFVVTVILRVAEHLPITTLELTTFSYAVIMLFTSIVWYQKPQASASITIPLLHHRTFEEVRYVARETTHPNMPLHWYETPLDFIWTRGSFDTDRLWQYMSNLSHRTHMPLFTRLPSKEGGIWERMPADIFYQPHGTWIVPLSLILQMGFWVSFIPAWNFHFATDVERFLWRASAVGNGMYSAFLTGYFLLHLKKPRDFDGYEATQRRTLIPAEVFHGPEAPLICSSYQSDPKNGSRTSSMRVSFSHAELREEKKKPRRRCFDVEALNNLSYEKNPALNVSLPFMVFLFPFTVFYIFCHLYIYVEDIISLRSQPASVYVAISNFFPGIG